jgi:hypothetical protein
LTLGLVVLDITPDDALDAVKHQLASSSKAITST